MSALIEVVRDEIFGLSADFTSLNEHEVERLQHVLHGLLELIEANNEFANEIKYGADEPVEDGRDDASSL